MKLNFIKVNPTENMTVFVLDNLPRTKYMYIANKLMNYNNINAEQVGFIERPMLKESNASVRLQMMGGEFCGNASRALAAVAVNRGYQNITEAKGKFSVPLEVSGLEEVIYCDVEIKGENAYEVAINMPLQRSLREIDVKYKDVVYKGRIVELYGISHAVFFTDDKSLKEEFFEKVKSEIDDLNYDAFGVMFFDEKQKFMTPLVYVKDTQSLIWERSCGTGTVALGVVLSYVNKSNVDMNINQPGGKVQIITEWNKDKVTTIILKGMVYIVAEGEVWI